MGQTAKNKKTISNTKIKKPLRQPLTLSPLDLCLKKEIISEDMHKAANFFIYLYRVRYGNKRIISDYGHSLCSRFYIPNLRKEELHNSLYKKLSTLLMKEKSYNIIRNTCIFSEFPTFLKTPNIESNNIKQRKECYDYSVFLRGMTP